MVLRTGTQQDLSYRQAYQLRVRQPFGLAPPPRLSRHYVVIDEDLEWGQKSVEVSFHTDNDALPYAVTASVT